MIDTIVLTLPKDMFYIFEPDKFNPSARWVMDDTGYSGSRGFIVSKQNPTSEEFKNGIYKPRLSVTRRFNHTGNIERTLKVELSLPKLIYNNNFDELTDKDFDCVVDKLHSVLKSMGVNIFLPLLKQSPISAIHYSKNIPLTDGSIPLFYLRKILEADINNMIDINKTDFRVGHCIKYHTNSYEVVFYDKIEDLKKARISDKRTIDKDSLIQLNLFNTLNERGKFEVLRMEIRLNKRFKIKQLFKSLSIQSDLTFQSLFNSDISKKVLTHYLSEIENKRPIILDFKKASPYDFASNILINNSQIKLKELLAIVGFKQISEYASLREIKRTFFNSNSRIWSKMIKKINGLKISKQNNPIKYLQDEVSKSIPLRLVDFQSRIDNNNN